MTALPTLGDAIDGIMDAIFNKLDAQRAAGGKLEGVVTLARGDIVAPEQLDVPAIWFYPATMQAPEQVSLSIREGWKLPVGIAAIVWSDKPSEGATRANNLAAAARGILITRDARQDLGGLAYVRTVKSGRFDPCNPIYINKTRSTFGALATVEVLFVVQE